MSASNIPPDMPLEDAIKLMTQLVRDFRLTRELYMGVVACVWYDILITLDQERALIWKARWSLGKVLYFFLRYVVAIEAILFLVYTVDLSAPEAFCKLENYISMWSSLAFFIPLQIVVVLRIIAIWDRRRAIVVILWSGLVAADIVILVSISRIQAMYTYDMDETLVPIIGCHAGLASINPMDSVPAFAALIGFDTLLFVLTLTKAIMTFNITRTRLMGVLFRDGLAYYCTILAFSITNTVFLSVFPQTRPGLAVPFPHLQRACYSIIGSRLILSLRGAVKPRAEDIRLQTFSSDRKAQIERRTETYVHDEDQARSSIFFKETEGSIVTSPLEERRLTRV